MSFDCFKELIPKELCLKCGKCKNFVYLSADSCFEKIPEACGYEGFMFMQREIVKKKIRKLKEDVMDFKIDLNNAKTQEDKAKILAKIKENEEIINSFAKYGSKDW